MLRAAMHLAFAEEVRGMLSTGFAPADFSRALSEGIERFDVTPDALCAAFETTRATVSRWKSENASPTPYTQREILKWLADLVEHSAPVEQEKILKWLADVVEQTAPIKQAEARIKVLLSSAVAV
jgi:hypothetical protein